jgi:hypothetical protein
MKFCQKTIDTKSQFHVAMSNYSEKKGTFVRSTFKIGLTNLSLFVLICYSFVPKIDIHPK